MCLAMVISDFAVRISLSICLYMDQYSVVIFSVRRSPQGNHNGCGEV
jgi:hypothetical protein